MRLTVRIRQLVRPPRVAAVTRRPAGWFALGRRRLHDVVAWALLDDGQIVGLVAYRHGLRPATGRRFHGYLPAAPHSSSDVQLSPPAVAVPVADLAEAIGDAANPWTTEAQAAIYGRLKMAAENEWAAKALLVFITDPERFLRRYFELLVEHGRPSELDDEWRAGLASINAHAAGAAEEKRS